MTSTTLARAIASTSEQIAYLSATTNVGAQITLLLVDKELMSVTAIAGKGVSVVRGVGGSIPATHASGATVYVITAADLAQSGQGKVQAGLIPINPNAQGLEFPDATVQTTAYVPTANPALSSVVLNGATSGTNTVAAPAIAGTTTTTLPALSGTLATEVLSLDLTAQQAAIVTATLFAVVSAGQYRVSWDAKVTAVDATSSTLGALTIAYTDVDGVVQTITAGALTSAGAVATSSATNTTAAVLLGIPLLLNCKAGTNITYAMAYASNVATTMKYNLHIKVEAL